MICCKTVGKPQIPSRLGPFVRLILTPEETDTGGVDYEQSCVELLLNIKVHYDVRSKYKQTGASPPECKTTTQQNHQWTCATLMLTGRHCSKRDP